MEWIESLETNVEKIKNINLNNDNLYFSFNYTKTLEEVYEILKENICHIHGTFPELLIFGHGKTESDIYDEYNKISGSYEVGSESAIMSSRDILRKDTEFIIENKKGFFEKIEKNKITNINVVGHSFGEVDMPYFQEILKRVDQNTKWNIFYYRENEREIFEKRMLEIGIDKKNLIIKHSDLFYMK